MKSKKNKAPEIDSSILENRNVKERITTLIDMDVVMWLRANAEVKGLPYQTYINMILREKMTEILDNEVALRQSRLDEMKDDIISEVKNLLKQQLAPMRKSGTAKKRA